MHAKRKSEFIRIDIPRCYSATVFGNFVPNKIVFDETVDDVL